MGSLVLPSNIDPYDAVRAVMSLASPALIIKLALSLAVCFLAVLTCGLLEYIVGKCAPDKY
jgi:hypothetical protein